MDTSELRVIYSPQYEGTNNLIKRYTVKNVVCYLTLRSAIHTLIRVVNTTQCHMTHQLVWYAQFVFYSVV